MPEWTRELIGNFNFGLNACLDDNRLNQADGFGDFELHAIQRVNQFFYLLRQGNCRSADSRMRTEEFNQHLFFSSADYETGVRVGQEEKPRRFL